MILQKQIWGVAAAAVLAGILTACSKTAAPPEEYTIAEAGRQSGTIENEAAENADALIPQNQQTAQPEETGCSVIAITPQGETIEWAVYSEGFYCYGNGSLYGYLSEDGEEITPCIYSEATPFSEGLACVYLDGKYGYIGEDGEAALPFIYDQASPFREGVAYFSCGEEYGLIDREGNVVLELTDCDSISSFREGLAYFSVDGQYGYMDKSGRIVAEPVYDDAGYFYDGLAVVMKDGFGGVIGRDGREILPPEYIGVRTTDACILAQKEDRFYLFDKEGNEVSSGAWDWVSAGKDDIFYIEQDDKEGFLDKNGNIILEPIYEEVMPIPEKELVIVQNENELYGVLDYEGQVRVPFVYRGIWYKEEADGLYVIDADTGKAGYLDGEDFTVKIPASYDSLRYFTKDRAVALLGEKYGVVRYDGTEELPVEYDRISLFSDGSMAVWTGGTAELTDSQGERIFTGEYTQIAEWGDGYMAYTAGKGAEYRNRQGKLVVSDDYDYPDSVYGAEKSYVLHNGALLRSGEEDGKSPEEFLLTNQITPRTGLFMEFIKNGSLNRGNEEYLAACEIRKLPQGRQFIKLYRMGDENIPMLYFYSQPLRISNFAESYSGVFMIRDGQVEQLAGASECGGSLRGDWTCFWYDTEEKVWKPGTSGVWGGWPGYAKGGSVYWLENGQAVREFSFMYYVEQTTEEYSINGEELSEEEYYAATGRYRYYLPIDHIREW